MHHQITKQYLKQRMLGVIILSILYCYFVIVHHLSKIQEKLSEIEVKINDIRKYQIANQEQTNQQLKQIDGFVSDIDDKLNINSYEQKN